MITVCSKSFKITYLLYVYRLFLFWIKAFLSDSQTGHLRLLLYTCVHKISRSTDEPSLLITFRASDGIYPSVFFSCGSCSSAETSYVLFIFTFASLLFMEKLCNLAIAPNKCGMFPSFIDSGTFKICHFVTNNPKHISIWIQSCDR